MSDFSAARQKMVDGQIRPNDVTNVRLLEALLAVPREAFVPDHLKPVAYLDAVVDLQSSDNDAGVLLPPAVLARMLQAVEIPSSSKVLVVGCSSGYTAAVLARLAAHVVSVASTERLVRATNERLASLGVDNAKAVIGTAIDGHPSAAPYDIIVMAGSTEVVPTQLQAQLAQGGRLVGVSAMSTPSRAQIVTRTNDDFGVRWLFDAAAPVLAGLHRKPEFTF